MKKLVMVLVVVFAIAFGAQAQGTTETKGLVGYGVKAGLGLADFTGSDFTPPPGVNKSMKVGFAAGGFMTYSFSPMFAIQPELLYTMKGTTLDSAGISLHFELNYVQIPVLLKLTPEMQGSVKPVFFAGPYLGLLTSAKISSGGLSVDIKDLYKSTEFGLTIGLGANFVLSKGAFILEGRYDLGLSKIEKEYLGYTANTKTGTIVFLAGYNFK